MLKIFCFALCTTFVSTSLPSRPPIQVSTSLGDIRGIKLTSRLGQDFKAFLGIRYAKNPVGKLRFSNPQPVESWKPTILKATEDGPRCPQSPYNSPDNSEDCLLLNVYSKNLSENALKPVIVYIHHGGLYASSGRTNSAGPQLLMDRNIVLVTFNYRLGTLGFLATGTAEAPGNAGLKDQVLALRWVRDHIRNFGGDPNSVTLLGYSAGSRSVGLHLVSPMSRGLFHRAIAMSGSPILLDKYPENQLGLARKQAKLLKCPSSDDINDIVDCLIKTPFEEFVKTFDKMFEIGYFPVLNWRPVIERDFGQERFLIEDPLISFEKGDFQKTPLIMGRTKDEFARIAYYSQKNGNITKQMNENWEEVAPIMLHYSKNTTDSEEISTLLKVAYEIDKQITNSTPFEPFAKLLSDAIIGFPVHRLVNLVENSIPVYYYCFTYKGRYSDFKYPDESAAYGSVHHDDLLYLFHLPRVAPLFSKTDPENKMVERLTRMWTQFAKTGNPNNSKDEYLKNLDWKPFNADGENYLEIGDEFVMDKQLFVRRMSIWEIIVATIS